MITEHITNANSKVKQVKGKNTPDFILVGITPTSTPTQRWIAQSFIIINIHVQSY